MDDDKPCCAAEALRRIRQVKINGIPTGITMLDEIIAEVKEQKLTTVTDISAALMKRVRVYNYVPENVKEAYAAAILEDYKKVSRKPNTKKIE